MTLAGNERIAVAIVGGSEDSRIQTPALFDSDRAAPRKILRD